MKVIYFLILNSQFNNYICKVSNQSYFENENNMRDVKDILDEAQEKYGHGHHVSGRSIGSYPRR